MTTSAKIGYGSTLKWNTVTVVELTKIGGVDVSVTKVDATTLSSPDAYMEFVPGLLNPGDVAVEGFFRPDDPAQFAMLTDMNARTSRTALITLNAALSSATWTFTAFISRFMAGEVTLEGLIPFQATLSISGKPALGVTVSGGMTAFAGIEENIGAALDLVPNFLAGVLTYTATVNTASTWVKLTVTAAAHTIVVTVAGVTHVLVSTVQSDPLVIGAANTVTQVVITTTEANKAALTYNLFISRP